MDLLHFTIQKHNVVYAYDDLNLKEVYDLLENNHYTAIPVITRNGLYVGTITEGDILRFLINNENLKREDALSVKISTVTRLRDLEAIEQNSKIQDLILKSTNQNFVPIVDENNYFIGIVTRKEIINYFFDHNFIVL